MVLIEQYDRLVEGSHLYSFRVMSAISNSIVAPSDFDHLISGYRLIWGYRLIGGPLLQGSF